MKKEIKETISAEYREMLDLLIVYCAASAQAEAIQAKTNHSALDLKSAMAEDYGDCQTAMADAKAALEVIARSHPEWFGDKAALKTPFGTLQFRAGTNLQIANEEMTLALIEQAAALDPSLALAVKTTKSINLEVLEKLEDAELSRFRVKRVESRSFSVKPAKVELGKVVSAQEEGVK